ncbi:MAG: substrate-binding domain-containing protein [Ruminococcus sp.]|nr:substrate-binding domain-containing protein [Ruminococcus sp.]
MSIKKISATIFAIVCMANVMGGCARVSSNEIAVISREDGSGTRGAFIELTGVEQKDADGNKSDMTTVDAIIAKSTDVVITQVSGNVNAIGYISSGAINDTVKAITVDGVEPTSENVKNGTYPIARPFNIATSDDVSDCTQDFINYILSAEGQAIVENDYTPVVDDAESFTSNGATGKIVIAGSTSVSPVIEKLSEEYQTINTGVTIEIQTSDSTSGMKAVLDGTCDIGMASRELKDDETVLNDIAIALDGIAIIVNSESTVDNLTTQQICDIYTGTITSWDEIQ